MFFILVVFLYFIITYAMFNSLTAVLYHNTALLHLPNE